MSDLDFVRADRVWLKDHPTLREKFVQDKIAEDPTILGLGGRVAHIAAVSQCGAMNSKLVRGPGRKTWGG